MALYCHFAFLTLCVICCRVAQYVGENIEPAISITPLGLSVHGARSIYIYRLAPCTENCSQKISKTFSHNNLEDVLLFCTFEPKKCKCAFRVAVSACTLKILCCGYNMATIKKDKKIKDYDTRSCSEMVIFLSLRKQGCKSASYAIYTLLYTRKSHCHENYTQDEKLYYLDVACRLSLFFFWWLLSSLWKSFHHFIEVAFELCHFSLAVNGELSLSFFYSFLVRYASLSFQ